MLSGGTPRAVHRTLSELKEDERLSTRLKSVGDGSPGAKKRPSLTKAFSIKARASRSGSGDAPSFGGAAGAAAIKSDRVSTFIRDRMTKRQRGAHGDRLAFFNGDDRGGTRSCSPLLQHALDGRFRV